MLRLFGPTRVAGDVGQGLPRAAFLAVALIDLAPSRIMTREALAARLWDGAPSSKASGSLRSLVLRVRNWEQGAGKSVFTVAPTTIGRNETTMPSDLARFLAIEKADTAASLRLLSELYAGDFLEGMEDRAELTGQWIAEQRAWLRDRFTRLALAGIPQVGGQVAAQVFRRLAEEAPFDDAVTRAGMVAARDDRAEVRAIYRRFAERLESELDIRPEARTDMLLRELTGDGPVPAQPRLDEPPPRLPASRDSVPRVLILPPAESHVSADQRRLGEALMDEVTHTLGRLHTFAVFAPHTARQLVTAPFPSGNPYGADYLVRARLVPGSPDDRLCVSLHRLETHEQVLTEELSFAPGTLNAHHFHLAAAIGTRLATGLERAERHFYRTTGSASAYMHYLLGCDDMRLLDLPALRRAKSHFRKALKLSPDFVAPRALLARAHSLEWILLDRNERAPIERAVALARQAAALDPTDPVAQREIGHALIYLGAIDEAVESLHSAAQLAPHQSDVLFHYGDGLVHAGQMREAREVMDKALSLNPLAPDVYYWVSATADYFLGDYAGASRMFRRMTNREPAARVIAAVEAMNGNLEEAARHRDMFLASHPDFRLGDYMIPHRPEHREHYLEGLRRAGFV